jgi:hypothetical protein
MVLLAVLALAAATGAMFGVVVFGNEFTKDVHPKGDTYANSVTLVDSQDRAVATADVESYVSILDLPLLGTAELNKVDGITFSTAHGIQHHKVTGYTMTKETATTGDAVVETPRLSLRSEPGTTIEVSVRDAKAWLLQRNQKLQMETAIDTTSSRRLSNGGSCLANGACLYSRDELLLLDAENRRLSEGSFFGRADIAAYQVDLSGDDVMPYLPGASDATALLKGTWTEDGSHMQLWISQSAETTDFYFFNGTSGGSKLITRNGSFSFDAGSELVTCHSPTSDTKAMLASVDLEDVATNGEIDFDEVSITHLKPGQASVPHAEISRASCKDFMTRKSNMSSPEFIGKSLASQGNAARKLASAYHSPEQQKVNAIVERHFLMHGDNPRNQQLELERQARADPSRRRLQTGCNTNYADCCTTCSMQTSTLATASYITHFDLWIATRMADPTFMYDYSHVDTGAVVDIIKGDSPVPPSFILELAGSAGVSAAFQEWSGYGHFPFPYLNPDGFDDYTGSDKKKMLAEDYEESKLFWHSLYRGTCNGGYGMGGSTDSVNLDSAISACTVAMDNYYDSSTDSWSAFLDVAKIPTLASRRLDGDAAESKSRRLAPATDGEIDSLTSTITATCKKLVTTDYSCSSLVDCYSHADFVSWYDAGRCTKPTMAKCLEEWKKTEVLAETYIGNAWASYLTKATNGADGHLVEYVVAFQGTKANDLSMVEYNSEQTPVLVWFNEFPAIIPKGYFNYMKELVMCLSYFIDVGMFGGLMGTGVITEPSFITGHSLGGAAATLFAKTQMHWIDPSTRESMLGGSVDTYPRLVTFGAAPTHYAGGYYGTDDPIECVGEFYSNSLDNVKSDGFGMSEISNKFVPGVDTTPMYCTASGGNPPFLGRTGYDSIANDFGTSMPCKLANPDSVRFFHKFDPVPSIGMWHGKFAHSVDHAVMVWDEYNTDCDNDVVACEITADPAYVEYGSSVNDWLDPKGIKQFTCDAHSVTPYAVATGCTDAYSSYYSLLNPWPCGQILTRSYAATLPEGEVQSAIDSATGFEANFFAIDKYLGTHFVAFEDYDACMEAWFAVIYSQYPTAMIDLPISLGLIFTFSYTHSSYGFYPLCLTTAGSEVTAKDSVAEAGFSLMSTCVTSAEESTCYSSSCPKDDPECITMCLCEAAGTDTGSEPSYCSDDYDGEACFDMYLTYTPGPSKAPQSA